MRSTCTIFFILIFIVGNSQKKFSEKQIDSVQNTIITTNAENANRIEAICTDLYYQSKELGYTKGQIAALLRKIAYKINISDLTNDELSELYNYIDFNGTPTTYIISNGKAIHTYTGTADQDTLSSFIDYFYIRNN